MTILLQLCSNTNALHRIGLHRHDIPFVAWCYPCCHFSSWVVLVKLSPLSPTPNPPPLSFLNNLFGWSISAAGLFVYIHSLLESDWMERQRYVFSNWYLYNLTPFFFWSGCHRPHYHSSTLPFNFFSFFSLFFISLFLFFLHIRFPTISYFRLVHESLSPWFDSWPLSDFGA